MSESVFLELSLLILAAIVAVFIVRIFKQPIIVGYLIAGVLASPSIFNLVRSAEVLATFSQIGVAVLLFTVGINLNPRVIKEVGKVSVITGLGQVLFTTTLGYLLSKALGFSSLESMYIAIALAFSSTIIIMKLLSDKKDQDTQYGKISTGFLIIQDIIAIFALIFISSLSTGNEVSSVIIKTFSTGAALIIALLVFGHYALPKIIKHASYSQEFLLLFSLGWCFGVASLFEFFNFSIEIGAFLAGITLSLSPYRTEINSKIKPIRDFFIFLFFIWLGTQMLFTNISTYIPAIIAFSLLVLIGNPLIVMFLLGRMGYKKRTSFLSGMTVAQISEFSLILLALGIKVGHITPEILSMTTVVALITIGGSTYSIMYGEKLYEKFSRYISIFERKSVKTESLVDLKKYDIILFGAHRTGYNIIESFKNKKKDLLVVDFDPNRIESLTKKGYNCMYGDMSDSDLLDEISLCNAKMVISTIPEVESNLLFLRRVKLCNPTAIVIAVAHEIPDATQLYKQGATYVITPHFIGGKQIADMIRKNEFSLKKFQSSRALHKKQLDQISLEELD